MIIRNLFSRKARSFLTLLGIIIGVTAMIALGAIATGISSGYQAIASGSQADLILSQEDAYELSISTVDERVGRQLMTMPEVADVVGMIMGNVSAEEGAKYFFIFGHDPQGYAIQHFKIIRGQGLDAQGIHGKPILLGDLASEALDVDVGDTLNLTGGTFRVVGIFKTGDGFEDGSAVMSLSDAQKILQKPHLVSAYYIQLKDTKLEERLRKRIERFFPDLSLATASEFGNKQQIVQIMEGLAKAVAFLAIFLGGLGMMNTVLMSVNERTREIGVLRALGWRRRRVLGLIIGESLILAAIGTAIGICAGVLLVIAIRGVPLYGVMEGKFSTALFLQTGLIALALGIFGGFYPAWKASKLQPLEAMQYDGGGHSRENGIFRFAFGGMAIKNLFRRKTRTVLTLIAIGIGIGAVVSLGAIIASVKDEMDNLAGRGNAHLMAIEAGVSDFSYSAIPENVGARLAAMPEIATVTGVAFGFIMGMPDAPLFIMWGYHPKEAGISHFRIIDGGPLQVNHQAVLGRTIAAAMGKKVGDTIRIGDSAYRVVGIFETGSGFEEMGGLFTRRDVQAFSGKPRQVGFYAIEVVNPKNAEALIPYLEEIYPEIELTLTSEFVDSLPDIESANAMMGGIAVILAFVGSLGMANTILMSVLERTREIGVLRALGWKKSRVLLMIIKESILLGGMGGLVGIGFGYLISRMLQAIPGIGGFYGSSVFSSELLLQSIMVAISLGVLGGLYPAWCATRMQPIEALRYE